MKTMMLAAGVALLMVGSATQGQSLPGLPGYEAPKVQVAVVPLIVLGPRERIAWNHSAGTQTLAFYDAGSNYANFKNYNYGTAWRLVGLAGDRMLWQEQVNQKNATLWRISETGDYVSHVTLTPPAPDYKARSLALDTTYIGDCYSTNAGTQRYWILWDKDAPGNTLYVSLVYGDANNHNAAGPWPIRKPAAMGTTQALALTPIYGGDLAVLFIQQTQNASIWTMTRSNMTFRPDEWVQIVNPMRRASGSFFIPSSLNAYMDKDHDGALLQVLFNDASSGPFQGRAMIVNVRETVSEPFGRQAVKREYWAHQSSQGNTIFATGYTQEATAHTIVPSPCP